ncbi:MAG TPA: carboxypeptidase-like regulatory domain-containing protein, partial [Candidatus Cybelea sp.]
MRSIRLVTSVVLFLAFISQGTLAIAGVTGGITGQIVDSDTGAPIAGAVVTASSPSQSATATTDAAGHFGFLTLSPDTYTISA